MTAFGFLRRSKDDFDPVKPGTEEAKLQRRVDALTGDEIPAYKWIRECYTPRWISETLLLDKRQTEDLIRRVCHKLGVRNTKVLLRMYGGLARPAASAVVDTEEIDRYVDDRPGKKQEETPGRGKSPPGGKLNHDSGGG